MDGGSIEKGSWRKRLGRVMMWASSEHLEATERHLEEVWEAFGNLSNRRLGGIWENLEVLSWRRGGISEASCSYLTGVRRDLVVSRSSRGICIFE